MRPHGFALRAVVFAMVTLGTTASAWAQTTFPLTATVEFETGLRKLATITLSLTGSATVDWGDGSDDQVALFVDCRDFLNRTCDIYGTHKYQELGTFVISIVYNPPGSFVPAVVTTTATVVPVGDFVVLSIGDSVGSGEGTPVIPRSRVSEGQIVLNRGLWDDPGSTYDLTGECHRTSLAGPALATAALRATNPASGITFLHVACSGAKINAGPVESVINQLRNARRALERARIKAGGLPDGAPINVDALLISAGANNIAGGFGTIVTSCITSDCSEDAALQAEMASDFAALPAAYRAVANELTTPTESTRGTVSDVYISEYFDPTRDETEDFPTVVSCPQGFLEQSEWIFLANDLVVPLNQAVAAAAFTHGWHLVGGIAADFRGHGYCANPLFRWVVTADESILRQGDQLGTAHPNLRGQQQYRDHIAIAVIVHTPPETTATAFAGGLPYTFGDWTAQDVVVSLLAQNPIGQSGIGKTYFAVDNPACQPGAVTSCSTYAVPFAISASGTHTVTFFSENQWGAAGPLQTILVRIDKDPPTMTCEATPAVLWSPNGGMVPVAMTVTAVDDVSGPVPFLLGGFAASEGNAVEEMQGFVAGGPDTEGLVRARRFGSGPGRLYAWAYLSVDALGNVGLCITTVVVPHDQR